jgi:hypothetical protein
MREEKHENDLFFVCSLVEYIGRATQNKRIDVIRKIGEAELSRIFELADVYHCEPIENTADELISRFRISRGDFDNAGDCKYAVPAVFDIGKVYKRLVLHAAHSLKIDYIPALAEAYSSPVASKIDDYNSSVYYESPQYIEAFFDLGEPPECCVA